MDQATLQDYSLKLEGFRHSDRLREELITDVLRKYDSLLADFDRKCDDYNNEVESRRMWQQKESLARNEVKQTRYATVSENIMADLGSLVCSLELCGEVLSYFKTWWLHRFCVFNPSVVGPLCIALAAQAVSKTQSRLPSTRLLPVHGCPR